MSLQRSISDALGAISDKRTARAVQAAFDMAYGTASVTSAGTSSQANSAPILHAVNYVTAGGTASTYGVRLPTPKAGNPGVWIINTSATYDLLVYPDTGGAINALSANAAYTLPAAQSAFFVPATTAKWYVGVVGATSAQIAYLTGATAGTAAASKVLVLDASLNIAGISGISTTGTASIAGSAAALFGVHGASTAQLTAIVTALTTGVGTGLVGFASTAQLQALVDASNACIAVLKKNGFTA